MDRKLGEIGRVAAALVVAAGTIIVSLTLIHAAGLGLVSTGVVLVTRSHGSPVTCTLTSAADTYVRSDQAGSSFGAQTSLDISNSSTETSRVLVSFDLAACSPAIASDALVHSATVRLTTTLTTTTSRDYALLAATSAWTEATTWSTQPSVAPSATSTATIPALTAAGSIVQWPAARDVQAFIAGDGSNLGWRLNDTEENGGLLSTTSISFSSSEAGSGQPQLVIIYAP